MNIHLFKDKIKGWAGERRQILIYIGILAGTSILAFCLGYVARGESARADSFAVHAVPDASNMLPLMPKNDPVPVQASGAKAPSSSGEKGFVASKNGKKYYPADCGEANRIKDGNKIFFDTAAAAESAGYGLASGC